MSALDAARVASVLDVDLLKRSMGIKIVSIGVYRGTGWYKEVREGWEYEIGPQRSPFTITKASVESRL